MNKINVAVVGLGFGDAFAEIYAAHPLVSTVTLCDTDEARLTKYNGNDKFALRTSFEDVLADKTVDAVHIVTPIPLHAEQSVAVLRSGKHCACAVPMATSAEDAEKVVSAARDSGKTFMLMETTLYTYQYLYASEMLRSGKIGRIQFLRGCHYQDMSGWPEYWRGLPPFWYGTHAIAPLIGLSGAVKRVHCFGSGSMDDSLVAKYNNRFPVESAILEFENGVKGEVTRSLFETARAYCEGFAVYGSTASFEWLSRDCDDPFVSAMTYVPGKRGADIDMHKTQMPNFYKALPRELWRFTVGDRYDEHNKEQSLEIGAGGGHHGSHAHLVHAFVKSIVSGETPLCGIEFAENLTLTCICAHDSAINGGKPIDIPSRSIREV